MEDTMKSIRLVAAALALCALAFCGCSDSTPDAYSLLCGVLLCSGEDIDGSGYIYSSTAEEGNLGYLSQEMMATLYGDNYSEHIAPLVEECSVFLSSRGVGELAVFKCYSRSDTDLVLKALLKRADTLKVGLRNTAWEEKSRGIEIKIKGKYLLFCFVENTDRAAEKFAALI